jgi:hypothetical protein
MNMGRQTVQRVLWVVGIFGYSAVAMAQMPPASTAGTRFDGTYTFVSSTKPNETGRMGQCPNRRPGPLTIANAQARFRYGRQREFEAEGTVRIGAVNLTVTSAP